MATSIPANGRPCVACYGLGRIVLAGAFTAQIPTGNCASCGSILTRDVTQYFLRCNDTTGEGLWPKPEYDQPCGHCSGTGVMWADGSPFVAAQTAHSKEKDQ